MKDNYRDLRVAVLGGGTVGAEVAHRLLEGAGELGSRSGAGLLANESVSRSQPAAVRSCQIIRKGICDYLSIGVLQAGNQVDIAKGIFVGMP